ncbi:MAG: hypothetical protein IJF01_06605, partial [Tidjanibacter sp.]|nr:hypothetical protein [Tidjanibacter sp.]
MSDMSDMSDDPFFLSFPVTLPALSALCYSRVSFLIPVPKAHLNFQFSIFNSITDAPALRAPPLTQRGTIFNFQFSILNSQ